VFRAGSGRRRLTVNLARVCQGEIQDGNGDELDELDEGDELLEDWGR
jgi:hypothetical protein